MSSSKNQKVNEIGAPVSVEISFTATYNGKTLKTWQLDVRDGEIVEIREGLAKRLRSANRWYKGLLPELKEKEEGKRLIEAKMIEQLSEGEINARVKLKCMKSQSRQLWIKIKGKNYWFGSVLKYNYVLDSNGFGVYIGSGEVLVYIPIRDWGEFEIA